MQTQMGLHICIYRRLANLASEYNADNEFSFNSINRILYWYSVPKWMKSALILNKKNIEIWKFLRKLWPNGNYANQMQSKTQLKSWNSVSIYFEIITTHDSIDCIILSNFPWPKLVRLKSSQPDALKSFEFMYSSVAGNNVYWKIGIYLLRPLGFKGKGEILMHITIQSGHRIERAAEQLICPMSKGFLAIEHVLTVSISKVHSGHIDSIQTIAF